MTTAPKFGQLLFASVGDPATATPFPVLTVGDINHVPYEATEVQRPVPGVVGLALTSIHAESRTTTGFTVGLVGSGTAGTAPVIGPILKACALSEVVTPTTSVVYSPVDLMATNTTDSVNIIINESGEEQVSPGNRGTVTFTFASNDFPKAEFSLMGEYDQPYTEPFPAPPDFDGQSLYKVVGADTKLTLIVDGDEIELCFESFSLTEGAAYEISANGGCPQQIIHTDMVSTWSATALRPALADINLWQLLEDRETFDIVLEHTATATAGYKITLSIEGAVIDSVTKAQIKQRAARGLSGGVLLNNWSLSYT